MPKRRNEDKINYYETKIQKLRDKQRPASITRRRCVIYSDSSSEEISDQEITNIAEKISSQQECIEVTSEPSSISLEPQSAEVHVLAQEAERPEEEIDEFLSALGDSTQDAPIYGEKIHEIMAQRWLPVILRRGISKETKETLLKEQKIPENCKLLRAPGLNPEISAALIESMRSRDKKIENQQQQLGLGITAVSRAMNILVTGSESKQTKVQAVKILSGACRILSDLHYMETRSRINLIIPALDKSFITLIQDIERDESLFGKRLSDKIKASKVIEKQGLQIKKPIGPHSQRAPAPSSSQPTPTNRGRNQGNWTAPSRNQPSNRGGRGSAQKTPYTPRRPSNAMSQAKNTKQQAPRQ